MTLRQTIALTTCAALTAFALTACSSDNADADSSTTPSPSPSTSESATSTPTATTEPEDRITIEISVDGRTITPEPSRVKIPLGDKVRMTVTSDIDNELHIHGYDLEEPLPAGEPVTVDFVADQAGLFEVETHDEPVLLLTQLQVQ